MGRPWKSLRLGMAIQRAQLVAFLRRALSVVMPVLAYIYRYSFEINRKASRARRFGVIVERFQIDASE